MRGRFLGVDVSLPSSSRQGAGGGAEDNEDEWQEVSWVTFTRGDVLVDDQFGLSITYVVGTSRDSKSLGELVQASGGDNEASPVLVVTTSDRVQPLYRLVFQNAQDMKDFDKIAQDAHAVREAAAAAAAKRRREAETVEPQDAQGRFEASVRAALAARKPGAPPPLLYPGVELFGPAPFAADDGSEVRLGQGIVALSDPVVDGKVGVWELLFFDEDEVAGREPFRKVIGPRLRFKAAERPKDDDGGAADDADGASDAHSMLHLQFDTAAPRSTFYLNFPSERDAQTFHRDLRVRQMVMQLSHKTSQGNRAVGELESELRELQQRSALRWLWRTVALVVLACALWAVVRVWLLYEEGRGKRSVPDCVAAILPEVKAGLSWAWRTSLATGAKACEVTFGMLQPEALERCLSAGLSGYAKLSCIERLLLASPSEADFA